MAADNEVKLSNDEPVLYTIFSNFLSKNKKPAPKKDERSEKLSQMPVQMKEDESEGEVFHGLFRFKKKL